MLVWRPLRSRIRSFTDSDSRIASAAADLTTAAISAQTAGDDGTFFVAAEVKQETDSGELLGCSRAIMPTSGSLPQAFADAGYRNDWCSSSPINQALS